VAIAVRFWAVWALTARLVHLAVDRVQTVFRGCLQQQFRAATRSVIAAVILQRFVFGLLHTYQGSR
jgi:hypothetical protein